MREQDVQNWLDEYGRTWVDGDPDGVVAPFSDTATYRETLFDEPMRGQHAIRNYWQQGAADAQEDVEFASQVWAVTSDTAITGWQARFTRKTSGARVTAATSRRACEPSSGRRALSLDASVGLPSW